MKSLSPRQPETPAGAGFVEQVARELGIDGFDVLGPVLWISGPGLDYHVRMITADTYESVGPYRKDTEDDPGARGDVLAALLADDGTDADGGES